MLSLLAQCLMQKKTKQTLAAIIIHRGLLVLALAVKKSAREAKPVAFPAPMNLIASKR
jgi:hypothetical protein